MPVEQYRKALCRWLLIVAAMVVFMIALGGLTRLTESGLSMVSWRPQGSLPPMTPEDWAAAFEEYKPTPEGRLVNSEMTLSEFKVIYWYEYAHRQLGRLIGMVYFLPMLFFWFKGAVPSSLKPKLIGLLFLGGLQGFIGWWMVKSGLVDRPDVSHYRLTVHLGTAFLLYSSLLWVSWTHGHSTDSLEKSPFSRFAAGVCGLVFLTVLSGGIVAGLNAGKGFNTFPLMAGELIPAGLLSQSPWYGNFTENPMTVQFIHRVLAISSAVVVCLFFFKANKGAKGRQVLATRLVLIGVLFQVGLGIATLLSVVWLPLASLHQVGAVLLLTLALWNLYTWTHPKTV